MAAPDGNRASLTYANGVVTSYTYNLANWVTSVTNTLDGEVLSSYTYTYYLSGNQETKTDHEGVVTSYNYDAQGRLTGESNSTEWTAYLYDAAGNRTNLYAGGTEEYSVTYTYDANDRLLTESKSQNETTTTTLYSYDANGNLVSQQDASTGQIEVSAYDGFNQLVRLESGGQVVTYSYNAQGIRTGQCKSGELKEFLVDGGNVVAELKNRTSITTYLRGMNLISGTSGDATSYYLYNAHGDVVQLTDSTGSITKTYTYDAFGNETNRDETDTNPFRYCGEYYDVETGHYYLRARYYDPASGRFTQTDTHWNTANMIYGDNPQKVNERQDALGLKTYSYMPQITAIMQSGNLYVYCVNNPLSYQDRTGRMIGWAVGGLVGGIFGAISAFFEGKTGAKFWGSVWGGVASGAFSGAVADFVAVTGGTGLAVIGYYAIAGGIGSAGGELINQAHVIRHSEEENLKVDWLGVLYEGIVGLLSGAVFGLVEGKVTALRKAGESLLASLKRILINELNLTNISEEAIKEFISNFCAEIMEWLYTIVYYDVAGELPEYGAVEP